MYNKNYGIKQTEESKYKAKVRARKSFKDFKESMRVASGSIDFVTHKKLGKKWQCHHKDMRVEHYENFAPDRFCCLGLQMHETIHYLYRYYCKDEQIIERIASLLADMKRCSNDDINQGDKNGR